MATGKRAGSRRRRGFRADILGLAVGITLLVVAWGYLVYAAIDFGGSARDRESHAWLFMGLAALGAVASLFAALMLIARLAHALTQERRGPTAPGAVSSRHRADVDPR